MVSAEVIPERQRSMGRNALAVLLAASTVAVGLMAGFFYAYACSVMVGLDRVDDRTFIVTMQWINATVRNAAFAPAFFGAGIDHRSGSGCCGVQSFGPWMDCRRCRALCRSRSGHVDVERAVERAARCGGPGRPDQRPRRRTRRFRRPLDSVEPTANRAHNWVADCTVDCAAEPLSDTSLTCQKPEVL